MYQRKQYILLLFVLISQSVLPVLPNQARQQHHETSKGTGRDLLLIVLCWNQPESPAGPSKQACVTTEAKLSLSSHIFVALLLISLLHWSTPLFYV